MKNYMAIDQFGTTYHNLGNHPRKELCKRLGRQHTDKMYADDELGHVYHIGYIIGEFWLKLFEYTPMREFVDEEEK